MNDTGAGRRQRRAGLRRASVLAIVVAGIAGPVAACGGSASPAGSPGQSNFAIALGYARCMRTHGAPNWPDPNSQGQFLKTHANSAEFSASPSAYKDCQHLLPHGGLLTTAELRQIAPLVLRFAACMRSHGITNFPDPVVNSQGVSVNPQGLAVHSPQFQAAQQACRKYMNAAGKYFPPG
jgi:hypothetical protein